MDPSDCGCIDGSGIKHEVISDILCCVFILKIAWQLQNVLKKIVILFLYIVFAIQIGDTWMNKGCSQKSTCSACTGEDCATVGLITTSPASCPANHVCQLVDGQYKCVLGESS